nr:His-Xaa-Ser system radical SAM maturase HxsC [uncultured Rhodopila sp.]
MAVLMTALGRPIAPFNLVVGRVEERDDAPCPQDTVLVCRDRLPDRDLSCFAAVLVAPGAAVSRSTARMVVCENLSHLVPGDLVLVNGVDGRVRTVFRSSSSHNALFVTERCNSNCLMCSQPPKAAEDGGLLDINLRIIELLNDAAPPHIGITGGEPTLLGDGFLGLLSSLKANLPATAVTALTNGRNFGDRQLAAAVARVGHPALRFSVPLHADVPDVHDHIAQSKGAFYQTVNGLYNMAEHRLDVEIRVVLHNLSIPRLGATAEWISRKLPFVRQVAFMGLETMGYVKKNWHQLWIDPADYADSLRSAVEHLYRRGMDVSIYNLPLCLLPPEIWGFARKSISDHKQLLLDDCDGCGVAQHCAGFFQSAEFRHSSHIRPISAAT